MFGRRSKLLQLMRLVPFVERNYNLIELGPKGTGKSHIFSEFSPHGILICLAALACQIIPEGFEVTIIVADNEPKPNNQPAVAEFAASYPFPVRYV
jgi:Putative ATP-dependent Lon protease